MASSEEVSHCQYFSLSAGFKSRMSKENLKKIKLRKPEGTLFT